jgi:hypothetical protein
VGVDVGDGELEVDAVGRRAAVVGNGVQLQMAAAQDGDDGDAFDLIGTTEAELLVEATLSGTART